MIITTPWILILVVIIYSTLLYLFFEGHIYNCHTYIDHIYFGTITFTTIGFGDMYPQTQITRIMSVFYILIIYYIIFHSINLM